MAGIVYEQMRVITEKCIDFYKVFKIMHELKVFVGQWADGNGNSRYTCVQKYHAYALTHSAIARILHHCLHCLQ